jgi:hypothetical protein
MTSKLQLTWLVFVVLFAAVSPAASQTVRLADCVSGHDESATCQVFSASNSYLSALARKDWNTLSRLGIETRSNSQLSQRRSFTYWQRKFSAVGPRR